MDKPTLSDEEWPEIRRVKARGRRFELWFQAIAKAVYKELPEEQANVIAGKTGREVGKILGAESTEAMEGGGKLSFREVVAIYYLGRLAAGDNSTWEEESPTKIIIRSNPPCGLGFSLGDIPPAWCYASMPIDEELIKAPNPDLNIKIHAEHTIMGGDPYCDMIIELED